MNDLPIQAAVGIDSIAKALSKCQTIELPLTHRFTDGQYIRTIHMPKGALVVSRVHKKRHPFFVTKGRAAVYDPVNGVQQIKAGHIGITEPGTQRVLYIHEDCEWTTVHAGKWDENTPIEQIEDEVTYRRDFSNAPDIDMKIIQQLQEGQN